MNRKLSAIVCTYNPDLKRLARVFDALKHQTLSLSEWECIVVDNRSEPELAGRIDLAWHSSGQVVREEALGLTRARLKGISEAQGEILVFVDDDCLLAPDYLATVCAIFGEHPFWGEVGGYGQAEYEIPPPAWLTPSLRQYHLDSSPDPFGQRLIYARVQSYFGPWFPIGAGMAIRRSIAKHYAEAILNDPVALGFDRAGTALTGAGDLDMGIQTIRQGFAIGKSRDLLFIHVVPKHRLELDYMLRLIYASQYSTERLLVYRGWHKPLPLNPPTPWQKIKMLLGALRQPPAEDRCWQALAKGKVDGLTGAPMDPRYCQS